MYMFITLVGFHSIYLNLLPDDVRPWTFVVIMLAAAFIPARLLTGRQSGVYFVPALALLAIIGIEYLSMISSLWSYNAQANLPLCFVSFISIWAVITRTDKRFHSVGYAILSAAHLLAVMGLYHLTVDIGSLAVSISWLLYGVSVIVFAFIRKDEVMAKSAMPVLTLAAGKALLYDASSAPTIIRIVCLLLTGAALYGSGFLMRKIAGWAK
jgi:Predicted membrane protein (DUF2339)